MARPFDLARLAPALLVGLALVTAPAASAAPAQRDAAASQRFEALLRAIDVTPSRVDLDRTWPDARERLLAAARDARRDDWSRVRATSILALYPDAGVRAALLELADDARRDVRKTAVYTVARAFGTPGDEALVAAIADHLGDADADVREHALRGLRWVDHPAAERLLSRLAASDAANARLAKRTLARRAARLAGGHR